MEHFLIPVPWLYKATLEHKFTCNLSDKGTLFHLHISAKSQMKTLQCLYWKIQHPVDYLYGVIAVLRSQLRPETCKNPEVKFPVTPSPLQFHFPQAAPHKPAPLLSDDSCAVFDDIPALRAVNQRRRGSQSTFSTRIKPKCFRFVF